nr:PREDICTED: protein aurora borealis isoform X2 [Bemisia tabaci]
MDLQSTPRARNPASKSRYLSLRKSEKDKYQSSPDDMGTPNKTVHFHVQIQSPNLKQSDFNVDVTFSPQQQNNVFSPLPLYKTPSSDEKELIPFNPFNQGLHERLTRSILSPSVFSTIRNPPKTETEFRWSIEDVARIKPANIEENFDYEDQMDPEAESQAQEAIERFFSDTQFAPSPSPIVNDLPLTQNSTTSLKTPCSSAPSAVSSTPRRDSTRSTKKTVDASVQTGLSLPPELPEEVEAVLSRYFIQPESSNDDSLSTSSMRRKLFFQCEDEPPSPVKPAPTVDLSPVTSGLASSPSFQQYFPSTPIITSRTAGTPNSHLSSPGCSPISYNCSGLTSPNTTAGSKASVRLDFSIANKENVPMDVSSDNAQDSLIKIKASHSVIQESSSYRMSYIEDSGNANFSLIKINNEAEEPKPSMKPFAKVNNMEYMNSTSVLINNEGDEPKLSMKPFAKVTNKEYMNSTSVLMPVDSADNTEILSQKTNGNYMWQISAVSKTSSSEDTGYQSRSCFNSNSESLDSPLLSGDSQNCNDSISMELPAKRYFSDQYHFKVQSEKGKETVSVSMSCDSITDS